MAEGIRFVRKLRQRGGMTIPSEVLEALGANEGDILTFEVSKIPPPTEARRGETNGA